MYLHVHTCITADMYICIIYRYRRRYNNHNNYAEREREALYVEMHMHTGFESANPPCTTPLRSQAQIGSIKGSCGPRVCLFIGGKRWRRGE